MTQDQCAQCAQPVDGYKCLDCKTDFSALPSQHDNEQGNPCEGLIDPRCITCSEGQSACTC